MWLSTPTVDSVTRPRVAVALISFVAAASIGYYTYHSQLGLSSLPAGGGLHRSNAVRRRRTRRAYSSSSSSSSSGHPGDENVDLNMLGPQADSETIADEALEDWWNDPAGLPSSQRTGHNIVTLLFRVSEDNARRNGCVHRGCQCNSCGIIPIRGIRYRCANCADFDLCETCEAQGVHIKTHIFYKIKVPAPPFGARQMQQVWYTGDPETCRRNLPRTVIAKLSRETGFERPELEAFWEQWTFMASTEWREDPDELGIAMDRKTFERCLVPTGGSRHAAPNLIHDRMFSFYDTNKDGMIGFAEFLHGLSYRKRKDKLRKVFEGYDIDGDGYVNRRDFLRMFRAYYVLYKQMHKDILAGLEDQLLASTEAQQLVTSRQPLSSLFGREGAIPPADRTLRFEGKTYHRDGTIDVADGFQEAVASDRPDTATRQDILTSLLACETGGIGAQSRLRRVSRSRRLTIHPAEQAHWNALLDPPTTLNELPNVLTGSAYFDDIEDGGDEEDGDDDDEHDDEDDDDDEEAEDTSVDEAYEDASHQARPNDSQARADIIEYARLNAPKKDKRRRDMARAQLFERWRRRQFYLDEEEGGSAPGGWDNDGDVLAEITKQADEMEMESSNATNGHGQSGHSRSSSRAREARDADGVSTQDPSSMFLASETEPTSAPSLPEAERDAGTEILYQVTQQAFNELLDSIFKDGEDLAVEAAETRREREKYKSLIDEVELPEEKTAKTQAQGQEQASPSYEKPIEDKTLEELLSDAGYAIAEQEPAPPNGDSVQLAVPSSSTTDEEDNGADEHGAVEYTEPSEHRDPTLPQFRPNQDSATTAMPDMGPSYPVTSKLSSKARGKRVDTGAETKEQREPTTEDLERWKRIGLAEARAEARGGWGKLDYDEFAEIYMSQEDQGNRLDYLGSWIDFCIR